MAWNLWISLGSIFAGIGVALGALASHALKSTLSPEALHTFEVGVRYQMYHALALICVGLIVSRIDHSAIKFAGIAFATGIILFSGSLYGLSFGLSRLLGPVTPLGGLCFLVGWTLLAFGMWQS